MVRFTKFILFSKPLVFLGLCACNADRDAVDAQAEDSKTPPIPDVELVFSGETIYNESCAICHLAGERNGRNAALIGSPMMKDSPNPLIGVILHGQSGISVENGEKLGGIMPAMPWLTDEEVAAVATYVRQEFGRTQGGVQPSQVAAAR